MKVLKRYGKENAGAAQQGCFAIGNLAHEHKDNQQELSRLGACETVIKSLKRCGKEDEEVAREGCAAIANLAHKDDVNKRELARVGANNVVLACTDNPRKKEALKKLHSTVDEDASEKCTIQ